MTRSDTRLSTRLKCFNKTLFTRIDTGLFARFARFDTRLSTRFVSFGAELFTRFAHLDKRLSKYYLIYDFDIQLCTVRIRLSLDHFWAIWANQGHFRFFLFFNISFGNVVKNP